MSGEGVSLCRDSVGHDVLVCHNEFMCLVSHLHSLLFLVHYKKPVHGKNCLLLPFLVIHIFWTHQFLCYSFIHPFSTSSSAPSLPLISFPHHFLPWSFSTSHPLSCPPAVSSTLFSLHPGTVYNLSLIHLFPASPLYHCSLSLAP